MKKKLFLMSLLLMLFCATSFAQNGYMKYKQTKSITRDGTISQPLIGLTFHFRITDKELRMKEAGQYDVWYFNGFQQGKRVYKLYNHYNKMFIDGREIVVSNDYKKLNLYTNPSVSGDNVIVCDVYELVEDRKIDHFYE